MSFSYKNLSKPWNHLSWNVLIRRRSVNLQELITKKHYYSFFYSEELVVKQLKLTHSFIHSYTANGDVKWYSHCGKSSFLQTEHVHTIQPSNCTLRHLSHRNENMCSQKNLYLKVYGSFICKSQKLATTNVLHLYNFVISRQNI